MEDLHIYFKLDDINPAGFDCLSDHYEMYDKLFRLTKKYAASDSLGSELLSISHDLLSESKKFNFYPVAGILVGYVAADVTSPYVGRKLEALLDGLDNLWDRYEQSALRDWVAVETYFCIAREIDIEAPYGQRAHNAFIDAVDRAFANDCQYLTLGLQKASENMHQYASATPLIACAVERFFNSIYDVHAQNKVTTESHMENLSKIVFVSLGIGTMLDEDHDMTRSMANHFSQAWERLYRGGHPYAKELVRSFLSDEMEVSKFNPTFYDLLTRISAQIYDVGTPLRPTDNVYISSVEGKLPPLAPNA